MKIGVLRDAACATPPSPPTPSPPALAAIPPASGRSTNRTPQRAVGASMDSGEPGTLVHGGRERVRCRGRGPTPCLPPSLPPGTHVPGSPGYGDHRRAVLGLVRARRRGYDE